jgi:hypothetical protein
MCAWARAAPGRRRKPSLDAAGESPREPAADELGAIHLLICAKFVTVILIRVSFAQ